MQRLNVWVPDSWGFYLLEYVCLTISTNMIITAVSIIVLHKQLVWCKIAENLCFANCLKSNENRQALQKICNQ